ncbi:MAG: hypothetical protein ABJA86_04125 [Nocardioidaceae bacterium]
MSDDVPRRPESDDDAWAQIIAGYDEDTTDPIAPWPTAEDVDDTAGTAGDASAETAPQIGSSPSEPVPRYGSRFSRRHDPLEDEDPYDTFIPPDPPPLPRLDTVGQFAWGGLIGGPLFLILAAVFDWQMPPLFLALAVTAFVVGFVTLVVRMNDGRPDDWNNDSGAVL